jgi:hypothetical protein
VISASALNRARRAAEAGMPDECAVSVATGATEWDPELLADVPAIEELYADRCELKWSDQVTKTAAGITVEGYVVKVPVDAPAFPIGALIRMTASTNDAEAVGREFHVRKLAAGSHITARRYQVVEVTAPDG